MRVMVNPRKTSIDTTLGAWIAVSVAIAEGFIGSIMVLINLLCDDGIVAAGNSVAVE
jgi:heme A synthase